MVLLQGSGHAAKHQARSRGRVPVLYPMVTSLRLAASASMVSCLGLQALDMLQSIKRAVGSRVPVLMDGGIRRGTDMLKVR